MSIIENQLIFSFCTAMLCNTWLQDFFLDDYFWFVLAPGRSNTRV
jgi:hypothetical protein